MTALYERTRDAMVALELAKLHEQAGDSPTAIEWYQVAADRFRRNDWRSRAEEAITRLGGTPTPRIEGDTEPAAAAGAAPASESQREDEQEGAEPGNAVEGAESPAAAEGAGSSDDGQHKRSRRGRRGGRRRKKPGHVITHPAAPAAAPAAPAAAERTRPRERGEERTSRPAASGRERPSRSAPVEWGPIRLPEAMPEEPAEERETVPRITQRSRAGDPGIASRMAKLDSMLRRLLAATPHELGDAEIAPAGPGVFLVSDSELTSYYYVEQCATLRIAIKMVLQGARGRDRERSVKSQLAEHLDITESQVTRYMKEHCVVRWLQTDEGASHLAHYAIAVLQPALNE